MGRFLQADPLWESFPTLSPYQYAFNNPMQYKDPTGLAPEKEKSKINIYKFV
jgi:RHS repeat-associated protein